ncbi:unnamed protein product [Amaranthus hypochondriacus]
MVEAKRPISELLIPRSLRLLHVTMKKDCALRHIKLMIPSDIWCSTLEDLNIFVVKNAAILKINEIIQPEKPMTMDFFSSLLMITVMFVSTPSMNRWNMKPMNDIVFSMNVTVGGSNVWYSNPLLENSIPITITPPCK